MSCPTPRGGSKNATGLLNLFFFSEVHFATFLIFEKGIRGEYEEKGVSGFYESQGAEYTNPHEPRVRKALLDTLRTVPVDTTRVLDLCCGSGEVTSFLRDRGVRDIVGCDPFTHEAFLKRTGSPAWQLSFADIADGEWGGADENDTVDNEDENHDTNENFEQNEYEKNNTFSLCVCSYAMHLCPTHRLSMLLYFLACRCRQLLILTPHKRPVLPPNCGFTLQREFVVERVRVRYYTSSLFGSAT
ncbi:MAG: hypothetical protein MHM6MM_009284 [Cercozoa sp. M6MM]